MNKETDGNQGATQSSGSGGEAPDIEGTESRLGIGLPSFEEQVKTSIEYRQNSERATRSSLHSEINARIDHLVAHSFAFEVAQRLGVEKVRAIVNEVFEQAEQTS